jgi:hypothetical protein
VSRGRSEASIAERITELRLHVSCVSRRAGAELQGKPIEAGGPVKSQRGRGAVASRNRVLRGLGPFSRALKVRYQHLRVSAAGSLQLRRQREVMGL